MYSIGQKFINKINVAFLSYDFFYRCFAILANLQFYFYFFNKSFLSCCFVVYMSNVIN